MRRVQRNATTSSADGLCLRLLDGFELVTSGQPRSLPTNAQRVLAYLALRGRSQARATLAGRLWEEVPQDYALASLRTALWRIRQVHLDIVSSTHTTITLNRSVTVDLEAWEKQAGDLLKQPITGVVLSLRNAKDQPPLDQERLTKMYVRTQSDCITRCSDEKD